MRQKIALVIVTVALTLVALEVGWRIYVDQRGTLRQKVLYLYSREEIDRIESLFRGMPYINFGLNPQRDGINSRGYRGPEIALPKPAGVYRIVTLGGSTTYGGYLDSHEQAWPHQLQLALRSQYGLSQVEVVNAGVPSYTSFESAANYMFRVQDIDPDMIIIYHATNDVTPRLVDPADYNGGFEARGTWRYLDEDLPRSALQRLLMHKLGDSPQLKFALHDRLMAPAGVRKCELDTQQDPPACVNLGMTAEEVLQANPPVYFKRNLDNIISMALSRDAQVLLLTWAYSPYPYDVAQRRHHDPCLPPGRRGPSQRYHPWPGE